MRTLILSTILALATICSAQNFQGKATYKKYNQYKIKASDNPALKRKIQALIKQSEQIFTLNFTATESLYKKQAKLSENKGGGQVVVAGSNFFAPNTNSSELYKNIKEQRFVGLRTLYGKDFIVADKLKMPKWELKNEKKTIGNYKCNKAILQQERTVHKFNPETQKLEPTKENYVITVWYTPDIPVSNGPEMYYGLPGLILEVKYDRMIIACTEVILNNQEKITIEAPTKGMAVNEKEFQNIKEKQINEMKKRYQNNRKVSLEN